MTCDECERNPQHYYYRIGNKEIGWSAVEINACEAHASYMMNILNQVEPGYTRQYHHLIDEAEQKRKRRDGME